MENYQRNSQWSHFPKCESVRVEVWIRRFQKDEKCSDLRNLLENHGAEGAEHDHHYDFSTFTFFYFHFFSTFTFSTFTFFYFHFFYFHFFSTFTFLLSLFYFYFSTFNLWNLMENHGAEGAEHDDHRDDHDHQTNHWQCNHLKWKILRMLKSIIFCEDNCCDMFDGYNCKYGLTFNSWTQTINENQSF